MKNHKKATVKPYQNEAKTGFYLKIDIVGPGQRKKISTGLTIKEPMWDNSSRTRNGNKKPLRDDNGVIKCKNKKDQENCILANIMCQRIQDEINKEEQFPEEYKKKSEQDARANADFIEYFFYVEQKIHPHKESSKSILVNWDRVGVLLGMFSKKEPIPFKNITLKLLEDLKLFLLSAPMGGGKPGTLSQSSASTYFSIVKAALKQAFIDDFINIDIAAKVKNIPTNNKRREALTMEEVERLAATPCDRDVLRRAAFFSILTGLRLCDIRKMKWGEIVKDGDGWKLEFTQKKTRRDESMPINNQAYELCGTPGEPNQLVFEGLPDASWISRPVARWMEAAGIKKHITFHCFRHTFATLQLTNGTDVYTVSKMLGHTNVRTTQIYAKVVDEKKTSAANNIHIEGLKK